MKKRSLQNLKGQNSSRPGSGIKVPANQNSKISNLLAASHVNPKELLIGKSNIPQDTYSGTPRGASGRKSKKPLKKICIINSVNPLLKDGIRKYINKQIAAKPTAPKGKDSVENHQPSTPTNLRNSIRNPK
jgi:hypothetical protein